MERASQYRTEDQTGYTVLDSAPQQWGAQEVLNRNAYLRRLPRRQQLSTAEVIARGLSLELYADSLTWQPMTLTQRQGHWTCEGRACQARRNKPDQWQSRISKWAAAFTRHRGINLRDGAVEWPLLVAALARAHR